MATGESKTKWAGRRLEHLPPAAVPEVSLTYEGKKSGRDILATPPAMTTTLWSERQDGESDAGSHLYFGENLGILACLQRDARVKGHVRLVYIDPPFATMSVFQSRTQQSAYADLLSGSHYIEFLRERLILLRELMATDGSIYVHLDGNMAFHAKVIMDEVFGGKNFRSWITRKKCNPKNYTRRVYGNISDFILFYTKSDSYVWNRPVVLWGEESEPTEYRYIEAETGRRFMKVPVHAPGTRNGATGQPWRGIAPPPGKHWQFPPATLDEMDARGEIYWSPSGNPRRKVYLDEHQGIPVQDIWLEYRDAHNQNIKVTGYPTEKNPDLVARIVRASSDPGDLVLDCFSGSGTTLAVSSSLGRRWIGVDNSSEAIGATLRRFSTGPERMGNYVSRAAHPKHPATTSPARLVRPPLFSEEEMPDVKQRNSQSAMVSSFSLHTTLPYHDELDEYLSMWRSFNSSAR